MNQSELNDFAERYTKSWNSKDPARVSSFFAENGSLKVNDSPAAVGRNAITEVARVFMTTFPDMEVICDRLVNDSRGTFFHWTLKGTNTGPGGTGKRVHISGYERWRFDDNGLIAESKGTFDSAEYERQLKHGVK